MLKLLEQSVSPIRESKSTHKRLVTFRVANFVNLFKTVEGECSYNFKCKAREAIAEAPKSIRRMKSSIEHPKLVLLYTRL